MAVFVLDENDKRELEGKITEAVAEKANILKGNISGEVINIDDVSPIEHTVKAKTSDISTTIKKCGKNLFSSMTNNNIASLNYYGVTVSKVDGYYVLNGTATSSSNQVIDTIFLPYGVYTLSAKNPQHNNLGNIPIIQICSPALNAYMDIYDKSVYGKQTKTLKASSDYQLRLRINKGTVYDNYIIKPQLEFGDIETEYEAFKGENITPSADGTVEFSSVSPIMTLFANKEGVMLDVEYNQDTNKVIDNIKADISKNSDGIANIKSLWNGKTWLTYGDSITAMGNGNDASAGWQKYVSERLNFAGHYGRGIGGQTFKYNTKVWFANADGTLNSRNDNASMLDSSSYTIPSGCTAHYGYLSSWDRITTMISEDIKDSIDLIFLFGVNDAGTMTDFTFTPPEFIEGSTQDIAWTIAEENTLGGDFDITTFTGAVASTIMKLQARCPKAMIVFGTSWSGYSNSNNANSAEYPAGQKIWKEGELVKQITNYFSIPCIDIWANSGVNPFNRSNYNQDNIHPYLTKGKQALARAVISGLMNIYPKFEEE